MNGPCVTQVKRLAYEFRHDPLCDPHVSDLLYVLVLQTYTGHLTEDDALPHLHTYARLHLT